MTIVIEAGREDLEALMETQVKTFLDDNRLKPPGTSLDGPPGYDSEAWNRCLLGNTPYYKIEHQGRIVGGIIIFKVADGHFEVGRIWVAPEFQNKGIGQASMIQLFSLHPQVVKWTLGTPAWAVRNQHFYESLGFKKARETEMDPDLGWAGFEYERKK